MDNLHYEEIPVMWTLSDFNKFQSRFNSLMVHNEDSLDPKFIEDANKALKDFLALAAVIRDSKFQEVLEVLKKSNLKEEISNQEVLRNLADSWISPSRNFFKRFLKLTNTKSVALFDKRDVHEKLKSRIETNHQFQFDKIGIGRTPSHQEIKDFYKNLMKNWGHRMSYVLRQYLTDDAFNKKFPVTKETENFFVYLP